MNTSEFNQFRTLHLKRCQYLNHMSFPFLGEKLSPPKFLGFFSIPISIPVYFYISVGAWIPIYFLKTSFEGNMTFPGNNTINIGWKTSMSDTFNSSPPPVGECSPWIASHWEKRTLPCGHFWKVPEQQEGLESLFSKNDVPSFLFLAFFLPWWMVCRVET